MSALNELLASSGQKGLLKFSVYDEKKGTDSEINTVFLNTGEMIPSFEISSSFVEPFILCAFKAHSKFFESLGYKNPENDYKNLSFKITLIDIETNKLISRRFYIYDFKKSVIQSNDGIFYTVLCCDVFGYEFFENTKKANEKLYNKVYNKKPLENVIEFLEDVIETINEKFSKLGDQKIKVQNDTEKYGLTEIPDDLKNSVEASYFSDFKFVNESPIFNLREYVKKFNIKIFQDFEGFHVIQHPVFSRFSKLKNLLSDRITNKSKYYIADFIVGKDNSNSLDRNNYKINYVSGKDHKTVSLDENLLYSSVLLNNNPDDYKNFLSKECINISGTSNRLLSSIYYDKIIGSSGIGLLNSKSVAVYLVGSIDEFKPGMLVETDFSFNTSSLEKQLQGDKNLSGIWFVNNCTFRFLPPQNIFTRILLTRFDNPKDNTVKEDSSILTPKQKNIKDFNSLDSSFSFTNPLKDVKVFANNLKDSIKSFNKNIFDFNFSLSSFISSGFKNFYDSLNEIHNSLRNVQDTLKSVKNNITQLRNILKFSKETYDFAFNNFLDELKDTITFLDNEDYNKELKKYKDKIQQINIDIENTNNIIKNFNKPDYSYKSVNVSSSYVKNSEDAEKKKRAKEEQLKKIRENLNS